MENVEQRVKKIVAEQLGVNEAEIKNESSFVDDLGADSLDTVELVMALEEEFETEIPGRGSREDHDGPAGDRLHRRAPEEVSASARGAASRRPASRTSGAPRQRAPGAPRSRSAVSSHRATAMSRRRVVVTGLGIVSPVGIGVAAAWANILAGRSGIARDHALRRVARSRRASPAR